MATARSLTGLGILMMIVLSVAGAEVSTTQSGLTWYQGLARPSWTPPDWLFGPVWTNLYVLMAVAAWLVWRQGGWAGAKAALALFGAQLVLNAAWSPVFFGLERVGAALAVLVALWVAILATAVAFWRCSRVAGILMLPYLAWVTFAGALNFAIWRMNP